VKQHTPEEIESGKWGFIAYCTVMGGKTFDGREIPSWESLPDNVKNAWVCAAIAILADIAVVKA
jgi:hypothetical protein